MNLPDNTLLQGGKYRIIRFISSGGFGCTYEAELVLLHKRVAIKEFFVKDFCNRDENTCHITVATQSKVKLIERLKEKFIEEASALFSMQHPNIVRVTDVFEENGTAYYVMDYIDGKSLQDIVKEKGALNEDSAIHYISQIADALKYVHSLNRLHLDVKPGNIMIDKNDQAILIDFGASKQYDEVEGENTSTLLGKTPGYAPLEQIGNEVAKFLPATDIYALGATFYKLVTGITPVSATQLASGETLEPIPATISVYTRNAISVAMEINKNKRPQSIDVFLNLLDVEKLEIIISEKKKEEEKSVTKETSEETVLEYKEEILTDNEYFDHSRPVEKKHYSEQVAVSPKKASKKKIWFGISFIGAILALIYFINTSQNPEQILVDVNESDNNITSISNNQNPEQISVDADESDNNIISISNNQNFEQILADANENYYKKNYEKAFYLYTLAAEQGIAEAQYYLGLMYKEGQGTKVDYIKAVELFEKADKNGYTLAKDYIIELQFKLGEMFYYGESVVKSYTAAFKWYSKAANQGHAEAEYSLGFMYRNGEGVAQNYSQALKWYTRAAKQGYIRAQYNLGLMYENGEGVVRNMHVATEWYKKAANQGDDTAKHKLEELANF